MVGPDRRLELAVPTDVVIADLLPVLVSHHGEQMAETGLTHGGWVLQRLGSAPFDEEASVATLGLHDGDTVHLRPRADQYPVVDFDDLIDGVAEGIREKAPRWTPAMTRWTAWGLAAVTLLLGLVALGLPGPPPARVLTASGAAVVSLLGAFVASRFTTYRAPAALLGAAGFSYLALAGMVAPDLTRDSAPLVFGGPQLFAGALAVALPGLLVAAFAERLRPYAAAASVAGLLVATAGALSAYAGFTGEQSAAVVAVASTVAVTLVPFTAFRMAKLQLTPLPTEAEHLQEDIDPVPSEPLIAGAALAARYMTALHVGLALPATAALLILGTGRHWAALSLAGLLALVRLLAVRPMTGAWQRVAFTVPAVAALVALAITGLLACPDAFRPIALAVVLIAVPALIAVSVLLPGRRLMPYWGRVGDIVLTAAGVGVLPVLLGVFDLYAAVRALGG
ncbi:type VII secretion integral membrane protein EccD [Catenuloplanes japonicus]|uniref:type VII secretion integral membrane protein EccD n=1 Tax=Catenuloplanes japonicus TaxID=33876 RepID=UPI00052725A3|nr:type VII secretion integral membrane protein EccD [Catenuloplanes japonicus]